MHTKQARDVDAGDKIIMDCGAGPVRVLAVTAVVSMSNPDMRQLVTVDGRYWIIAPDIWCVVVEEEK